VHVHLVAAGFPLTDSLGRVKEGRTPIHDRDLLLHGPKRNAVLDLSEVERYGADSFGDEDYVSIYGMRPAEWFAKGIRLLGRTAVECTRDVLADAIGKDIASVAGKTGRAGGALVIDPFAGSANTLVGILRRLPGASGMGFELDSAVFRLTAKNLALLSAPIDLRNVDYLAGLEHIAVPAGQLVVLFIAPPWGRALSKAAGLDLRRTTPPILEVADVLLDRFKRNPMICAVQVHERVEARSLAELKRRFSGSSLHIYDLNQRGENHGILLGRRTP
jgi:hypothetical protein